MSKRIYNIIFHLHTVSSIVISVTLFVIFFAGSFSFFRDEIVNWERNHSIASRNDMEFSFDQFMDSLTTTHDLHGREISISKYYNERRVNVSLSVSLDTLVEAGDESSFFYLDTKNHERSGYEESYTLGEFLYRLHFFAQIPYPFGYYLSGFVSFFFMFAVITGVVIHWDKIIRNFYVFRPWAKLKTMWTDAHTALGLIGLPFQFVYAVTGAFFMLNILIVAPSVFVLYDGDRDKLYDELGFNHPEFTYENEPLEDIPGIDHFIEDARNRWDGINVGHVIIHNYGDKSMHVTVEGRAPYKDNLAGVAEITYHAYTGKVVAEKDHINNFSYLDKTKILMYQLHFGDYGNLSLRVISFVFGLISCFVILSGVMIWLVAREKKKLSDSRKKFNQWVGHSYIAICMSMLPTTALAFIAVKVIEPAGQSFIYYFYSLIWLGLSLGFTFLRNNKLTTELSLISGAVIGIFIPIVNGISTGTWFWTNIIVQNLSLAIVDILWILLSLASFYTIILMKRKPKLATT